MPTAACRFCRRPLVHVVADLGMSPLANSYVAASELNSAERFYPLRVLVCDHCWLVQLEEFEAPERIFGDYAYFSSYSTSWVEHARAYVELAVDRLGLGARSQVVEIASNDGYLLQHVVARDIPALGIEPAANVARAAIARGIPTRTEFFGSATAAALVAEGLAADLLVGNNVFAHVPDLNDFAEGLRRALRPRGTLTLEFPHLLRLLAENQFDTIYHEHFSYFSLTTAAAVLAAHGLHVYDVEELPTHGGSLRVWAHHVEDRSRRCTRRVDALLAREHAAGLLDLRAYREFGAHVRDVKLSLLEFLIGAKRDGKTVVGYGAAAKGNTLLNYCGIRTDFLDYVVDRSPAKQGRYLPGTHVPIVAPERIAETRPDYVLILPWNLRSEIVESMSFVRDWGGQFLVPIPEVKVC